MRRAMLGVAVLLSLATQGEAQQWSWRFDKDGDLKGFTPSNFAKAEVSGGAFRGVTKYDCMLLSPTVSIDASAY